MFKSISLYSHNVWIFVFVPQQQETWTIHDIKEQSQHSQLKKSLLHFSLIMHIDKTDSLSSLFYSVCWQITAMPPSPYFWQNLAVAEFMHKTRWCTLFTSPLFISKVCLRVCLRIEWQHGWWGGTLSAIALPHLCRSLKVWITTNFVWGD